MLDGLNLSPNSADVELGFDDPTLSKYFVELIQFLPTDQTINLWKDIVDFEKFGKVSDQIETLLNRARIVAEADRIIAKY